ncbi:hypothetical protein D1AOALGA4SA_5825 [Olavius algarvensis Delta 1 endosymbiont]|nr:hypothetical protein D1AOALGA4SA_5825 [Olavius algarvensis Delta 1 endosymbiont]
MISKIQATIGGFATFFYSNIRLSRMRKEFKYHHGECEGHEKGMVI